jgi:outer membrane protein
MTTARFAFALAALLFTATHTGVALAQKIGVVDLQRALVETEDGRKAKDQLKKLFEQRQKTLDKQQDDLKAMKENVEKQRDVLAREVWAKKVEDLQKALAELQTTYMEFQRELQAKEAEMLRPIQDRMQRIVKRLGQAEGYSLIVDRTVAYFVPSSSDLTDVLIQRYNAGEGKDDGTAKGGKAAPTPNASKAKAAPK